MNTFLEILSPSYLLFSALLGTLILGLVCPLIGSYLILRRTVFLGLTLPQIAAAGVSFTFWLQQTGFLPQWEHGERGIGMIGSLVFTFLGMGLLGYLEQRRKGLAEGRLAAAYAFAGALTILFIVFNPAGQIEVLNLLKGEVIGLSKGELQLLATVFGLVLFGALGTIVGIFAETFDHHTFVNNIVILPLTFVGGVFYPVEILPSPWEEISHANPIFYLVNAVRYGFLGASDVPVWLSFAVTAAFTLAVVAWSMWLFSTGRKLKP